MHAYYAGATSSCHEQSHPKSLAVEQATTASTNVRLWSLRAHGSSGDQSGTPFSVLIAVCIHQAHKALWALCAFGLVLMLQATAQSSEARRIYLLTATPAVHLLPGVGFAGRATVPIPSSAAGCIAIVNLIGHPIGCAKNDEHSVWTKCSI